MGREILDLIPRLQVCWFKLGFPNPKNVSILVVTGRHTGWGIDPREISMFGFFFLKIAISSHEHELLLFSGCLFL